MIHQHVLLTIVWARRGFGSILEIKQNVRKQLLQSYIIVIFYPSHKMILT